MPSTNQVLIFDTTLRDGSQAEGISFSAQDKMRIAQELDRLGIHYIEGGWPGSNPKDELFFSRAKKELKSLVKVLEDMAMTWSRCGIAARFLYSLRLLNASKGT